MGERLDQWIERHSRNAAQYARLGYHPRKKREILHRFLLLWLITGAIWAFGCLYCANKWWYLAVPACLAVSGIDINKTLTFEVYTIPYSDDPCGGGHDV